MCILTGCDYLPSLSGMGIKTAHRLIQPIISQLGGTQTARAAGASAMVVNSDSMATITVGSSRRVSPLAIRNEAAQQGAAMSVSPHMRQ